MLELLLCILANVGIFMMFRIIGIRGLNTLHSIWVNYFVCVITGYFFAGGYQGIADKVQSFSWLPIAIGMGLIFITTFYLMARTTQVYSITVSSIAAKMSLVIPVLLSILILKTQLKSYSVLNYLGILLAFPAIVFTTLKPKKKNKQKWSLKHLGLPVAVFVLGGLIDSVFNYTNLNYLTESEAAIFPIVIFACAALFGGVAVVLGKKPFKIGSVIAGLILGVVNYFSVYYLLRSLTVFNNDGAYVYPIINVGIILISAVVSFLFFNERLSRLNALGIGCAILAILLLSYQELLQV